MLFHPTKAISLRQGTLGLPARVAILAALFLADKVLLNQFVDFDRAQTAQGLGAFVRSAQHLGFRFVVALIAAVVLFAYVRGGRPLETAAASLRASKLRIRWMLLHILSVIALIPLSAWLYRDDVSPMPFQAVAILGIGLALSAAGTAVLALAPWEKWLAVVRSLGVIWAYALVAALVGAGVMQLSQRLWAPMTAMTFMLVRFVLLPILPALNVDVGARSLGTDRFDVLITDECSGLEGLGLVLAFSAAWLFYFRDEYRFPRALILIPGGLSAIFVLNILRIAGLVLIGNAGYPDVAVFGFHSQAGWIAFNAVACGLVHFSRKSAWLNREAGQSHGSASSDNPTAAYLMPLLALLAAGSLSHAMSGQFENFYPLRMLAGGAALWAYRDKLAALDWRVGWRASAVGIAVFVIWMIGARWAMVPASMPDALAAMSAAHRDAWLASRIATSVLIVPLAEEIAYRGYLTRRLISSDFESVAFQSIGWLPLTAGALLFGLAHGALWLPGIAAGLAYGVLVIRTGRMGEAVMAHAVTNGLVAIAAIEYGQWNLW
jgi:exosortase E/protease (VPEID-CTERM system)